MLFLLLSLIVKGRWLSFLFLQASLLSKSPFVFHSLYFGAIYLYKRQVVKLVITAAVSVLVLFYVFQSYYIQNAASPELHGLYIMNDQLPLLAKMGLRGAKIVEGLTYNIVPLPAVAINPTATIGFAVLMLVGWVLIVPDLIAGLRELYLRKEVRLRNWSQISEWPLFEPVILAGLLAISYAFGSHLRIYCPTLIFVYAALALCCKTSPRSLAGMAILILINMYGIFLSIPHMDSGCYDLATGPESCHSLPVPADVWNETRSSFIDTFAQFVKSKL